MFPKTIKKIITEIKYLQNENVTRQKQTQVLFSTNSSLAMLAIKYQSWTPISNDKQSIGVARIFVAGLHSILASNPDDLFLIVMK